MSFHAVQSFRHACRLQSGGMTSSIKRFKHSGADVPLSHVASATTPSDCLAFATAKSFGDFVIAHSVLQRVQGPDKDRLRLISNSHVKGLNGILPDNVCVSLVDSESDGVPALFDIKKRGAVAAMKSAWSLRREFHKIERRHNETLAFATYGVRERFIAGGWPVIHPRIKGRNIYETYLKILTERDFRAVSETTPTPVEGVRSIGIFPESRLLRKQLTGATLSTIFERVVAAGLEATLFILDGDVRTERDYPNVSYIPRDFASLRTAIISVDCVISADSLPAHLAEYFGRPTFVALPAPNEYWMPLGCFNTKRWGVFSDPTQFCNSLDGFLAGLQP